MTISPALWPPQPLDPAGWLPLAGPVSVSGPWTDVVRHRLHVLDPLPLAAGSGAGVLIATHVAADLAAEAYRLAIDGEGITLAAATAAGAGQACVTIRQLLPAEAWRATARRRDDWRLPWVQLADAPAHAHRGFMLDVARHFAPVHEVLRWLDLAALHRLNRLHLHLTDDQGWRLPSAAYPRLAEIGSWRTATWIGHHRGLESDDPARLDDTPHGGHYTRGDLREITEHADRLGITIVPEVDLPGHACALLAAIPELAVPGTPPQQVATQWGLLGRTISPLPDAMAIIATLLGEAADAIASPYLHIGGDEADLAMWRASAEVRSHARPHGGVSALRGVVNAQLARMVLELGRTPIAWDDAFVAGGLPSQTVIMPWRSVGLGLRAATAGHDVVMSPVLPTYLDYAEAAGPDEPLSIAAPQPAADVAAWVPPAAAPGSPGRVLGGQAQLWTEYTPDQATREYRAFPRLTLLASNLWRGAPTDLEAEAGPLAAQLARLDALGVNRRPLAGPHPWQRPGTGRRAPVGVPGIERIARYLAQAAAQAEPPAPDFADPAAAVDADPAPADRGGPVT